MEVDINELFILAAYFLIFSSFHKKNPAHIVYILGYPQSGNILVLGLPNYQRNRFLRLIRMRSIPTSENRNICLCPVFPTIYEFESI